MLPCNRDEAADLLLVLSPPEDSFCRGRAVSCSVLSCMILQMGPDILEDVQQQFDVTGNNRCRKSSFLTLHLQRRCILVRVPRGVKNVTVSGVWTMSRAKFSEHPLIHNDEPTCSDRHRLLTDNALTLWLIHSAKLFFFSNSLLQILDTDIKWWLILTNLLFPPKKAQKSKNTPRVGR